SRSSGFHDGIRREWRRNKNNGGVCARLGTSLLDSVENRNSLMGRAAFARCDTAHDRRSVVHRLLGVKRAFSARNPLHYQPCVFIYKYTHLYFPAPTYSHFVARTTFSAASFIPSATIKFSPEFRRMS